MAGAPEVHKLDRAGQVEMRLVAAGARRDLGQVDAAVVTLQSSELASHAVHAWTARLRYAYADALLAAGREDEARDWFAKAAEADHDGSTDASDRLAQIDGVAFVDAFDEDEAGDRNETAGDEEKDAAGSAVEEAGATDAEAGPESADAADEADRGAEDAGDSEAAGNAADDSADADRDADRDAGHGDDEAAGDDSGEADDSEDADVDDGVDDDEAPAPVAVDDPDVDLTDEADPSSFLVDPFKAPGSGGRPEQ
jgi:hypothetical protein